jgi:hypothetical protein
VDASVLILNLREARAMPLIMLITALVRRFSRRKQGKPRQADANLY